MKSTKDKTTKHRRTEATESTEEKRTEVQSTKDKKPVGKEERKAEEAYHSQMRNEGSPYKINRDKKILPFVNK